MARHVTMGGKIMDHGTRRKMAKEEENSLPRLLASF